MYEDISIADDFDVWLGVVSGGVSLLIRPAETNPTSPDIFQMTLSTRVDEMIWNNPSHSSEEYLELAFILSEEYELFESLREYVIRLID